MVKAFRVMNVMLERNAPVLLKTRYQCNAMRIGLSNTMQIFRDSIRRLGHLARRMVSA